MFYSMLHSRIMNNELKTLLFRIKSILIHEYQHNSTRVNMNQYESTQVRNESTRVRHESDTIQHESARVLHNSTRINTSQKASNRSQHESTQILHG